MGLKPPKWSFLVEKDGKRISIWVFYLVYGAFRFSRRKHLHQGVSSHILCRRWRTCSRETLSGKKNNCENQGSDVTIANGNQSIPVNIMWYSLIFHIIPCYSQHMSRGLSSIFQQGAGFSNSSYWTQSASHGATSSVSSMHGRSPRGVLCRRWSFKGLISARKHHWAKKVEN